MHTNLASSFINIPVRPLEKQSFAPFGDVIETDISHKRLINQGKTERYHNLAHIRSTSSTGFVLMNIFRGTPVSLPIMIHMLERHPYGSQAFYPIEKRPFLVIVAKDIANTPQQPQAFLAKAGQGINYHPNIWHHPLTALEQISDFIVIDYSVQENNLEEYFYDKPYQINSIDSSSFVDL